MQVLIHFFAKLLYFLPFLGVKTREILSKNNRTGKSGRTNDGMMEWWNDGMMEWWNGGMME